VTKPLFKFDTSQLELATRQLVAANGKDLSDAFNKKMGWLLRRWLWLTPKADKSKMVRQLGLQMKLYQSGEKVSKKTGKVLKFKGGWKIKGAGRGNVRSKRLRDAGAMFPLIFAIINKRKGGSPFKGKTRAAGRRAMAKAVKRKTWFRTRSIGYLKSAIASAQKPFLPFSSGSSNGVPPAENDSALKPVGRPKGFGTLATPGNRLLAVAVNKALTRKQGDRGLMKYALPALRKAYADELADTQGYLEQVLRKTARRVGVKTR
jgi:hypothetical protein